MSTKVISRVKQVRRNFQLCRAAWKGRITWLMVAALVLILQSENWAADNTAPTISNIPDVVGQEDQVIDGVSYTVGDAESDLQSLQVTAHSSNADLIPDGNITVIRAGYSGLIVLRPFKDAFGEATITATVTDPEGASSFTTFHYTVEPVNDPPTLDAIADLTISENAEAQTVPLTGITSGAANEVQPLAVYAFATPPGIVENLQVTYTSPESTGTLNFTTVNNANGKVQIDVLVDDGAVTYHMTSRTFFVQVNQANFPPVITSIPDQVTEVDTAKTNAFQVGDQETPAELLVISVTSSNPSLVPDENVQFEGSGSNRTVIVTPLAAQTGSTIITLTVSDGSGLQASTHFGFSVRQNLQAPGISSQLQSQTAGVGGTATFSVVAIGDELLSYVWQHDGVDVTDQTNATLVLTNIQPSDAGAYTVIVSNAAGVSTSAPANLRVLVPPTLSQIGWANGVVTLEFESIAGLDYVIEYKNLLTDTEWKILDKRSGFGGPVQLMDPGAKWATRYYRVRVE